MHSKLFIIIFTNFVYIKNGQVVAYIPALLRCFEEIFDALLLAIRRQNVIIFNRKQNCNIYHALYLVKIIRCSLSFCNRPPPPCLSFEAVYCLICGRRRVAVARYRNIVLITKYYDKIATN